MKMGIGACCSLRSTCTESLVARAPMSRKTGETWGTPTLGAPVLKTSTNKDRFRMARFRDFRLTFLRANESRSRLPASGL
jgi:hypothetical protein